MKVKENAVAGYRDELRARIIETASPLFKQRGIRAVRMDEIASMLTISKRTLYEVFDNKEALLLECIKQNKSRIDRLLEKRAAAADNEMEVLIEFLRNQMDDLQDVCPAYFTDLAKYESVMAYLKADGERRKNKSREFTTRGVEHGYFIPNLNYDIFNVISDAMVEYAMKSRLYEQYPIKEIMHTFVTILLRGCCTEKGRRILDSVL